MSKDIEKLQYLANHPVIKHEHIMETTRLLRKLNAVGHLDLMDDLSLDSMIQLYRPPATKPLDKFEIIANFKGPLSEKHKADIERLKNSLELNGKLTGVEEMTLNCIMEMWNIR
jgi:hypothetical protein